MLEKLIKESENDEDLAAFLSAYIDVLYDDIDEENDEDVKPVSKSKKKTTNKKEKEETDVVSEDKPKTKVTRKKATKKEEKEAETDVASEEKTKAKVTKKKATKKEEKEVETDVALEEKPKAKVTRKKATKKEEKEVETDVASEEKSKAKVTKKKATKKEKKAETDVVSEEKEKSSETSKKKMQIHEIAKEGIEKHVNELCIEVCQDLWNKNIYTKSIKVDDENIEIVLDKLNGENNLIFEKRMKKDTEKYYKDLENEYTVNINRQNKSDKSIKTELKNAVKYFVMQDVEIGFVDKQKFLMNICDCEKVEGMKENAKKLNLEIVFDENKMEKTFEEYLKEKDFEHLYLEEEDRIYLDKFYLDGHINYLKSKEK